MSKPLAVPLKAFQNTGAEISNQSKSVETMEITAKTLLLRFLNFLRTSSLKFGDLNLKGIVTCRFVFVSILAVLLYTGCSPQTSKRVSEKKETKAEPRQYAAHRDALERVGVPPLTPVSVPPSSFPPFVNRASPRLLPPTERPVYSSFFGNEATGERVAYVIDYSGSMLVDGREDLLRLELERSLGSLPGAAKYTIIMFMAEAWRHEKSPEHEMRFSDEVEGWIPSTKANITKSIEIIRTFSVGKANQSGKLGGTNWEAGLAAALAMRPKPDVIYFMTDGLTDSVPADVADADAVEGIDGFRDLVKGWTPELARILGETDADLALRMGRLNSAGEQLSIIHAVSMMEPEAAQALGILARENRGTFSIVSEDGSVKIITEPQKVERRGKVR